MGNNPINDLGISKIDALLAYILVINHSIVLVGVLVPKTTFVKVAGQSVPSTDICIKMMTKICRK